MQTMKFRLRCDRAHEKIQYGLAHHHLLYPEVGHRRRPDARIQLPDSLNAKFLVCPSAMDGVFSAVRKKFMNLQVEKFLRRQIPRLRRIRA